MDPIKARGILREYTERVGVRKATTPVRQIDFNRDMFPLQQDVVNGQERRQALLCGRRSGKSYSAAYALVKTAYERSNAECVYLALTLKSAKRIILPALKDIIKRYRIGAKYNYSEFTFEFDNGSFIRLLGADMEKMADRIRGSSFDLAVIDEAQGFGGHLESLIKASLVPALRERDGRLILIGTPGPVAAGLFYEVTTDQRDGWLVRRWNLTQNEFYSKWRGKPDWHARAQQELDSICREEDIERDSSYFIREYLGHWVEGDEQLVYTYTADNDVTHLPQAQWNYILSVDYGITDPCAILVGAYSADDPDLYIVDAWKQSGVTPQLMADRVAAEWNRYRPVAMVVDGGGIGAAFVAQMTAQYDLPFELAEKRDKLGFVELLNDDFKRQRIRILAQTCGALQDELRGYKWADPVTRELPETADDHCCDALLYMWRKSLHFKGVRPEPQPEITEAGYANKMREEELRRVREMGQQEWWAENY